MPPRLHRSHSYGSRASPHRRGRTSSRVSIDSNEADDERSSSETSQFRFRMTMGSAGEDDMETNFQATAPAYPGEDTRRTSKKELSGFYTYSFAAEAFVVCGLGAFIPITLESLARESPSAVLAHDHSQPCKAKSIDVAHPDLSAQLAGHGQQCVFNLFGAEINTASFAMYTFSISVLLQALVVVTMSGAADHGRFRKTLLLVFAVVGSIATMLFLPVTPNVYLLGSVWATIGNVCFGASFVLLNSFLPLLVRHHPTTAPHSIPEELPPAREDPDSDHRESEDPLLSDVYDPTTALLPNSSQTKPYPPSASAPSAEMRLSTKISSYGVGIGYTAAVIVQILSILILNLTGSTLFSLRLVLFLIGFWWLAFTIPAAYWLRPRPGPPLTYGKHGQKQTWISYLTYSWLNLYRTLLRARRLKDVILFLLAWFMISDAVATVSGTAILFAKTTLSMPPSALALINVIVTIFGILGAFSWSKLSRTFNLSPSQTILTCICLFELIPLYGLLGYIPFIQNLGVLGLQQPWEMYPLGAVYGLVLGGLSSYCRSLYGELIPPGSEAAFYALYAITDKGSSVFGPAIVGAITDATGDIRPAFWFLAVLIGMPIPIMLFVDVERGRREGRKLARENVKPVGNGDLDDVDQDPAEYDSRVRI